MCGQHELVGTDSEAERCRDWRSLGHKRKRPLCVQEPLALQPFNLGFQIQDVAGQGLQFVVSDNEAYLRPHSTSSRGSISNHSSSH